MYIVNTIKKVYIFTITIDIIDNVVAAIKIVYIIVIDLVVIVIGIVIG
jgi:hypothetical protein